MKAANMYDKTKPKRSDSGKGIHNQEKQYVKVHNTKANHDEYTPSGIKTKPYPDQDHDGFQFGKSPMKENSFEKELILKEKIERALAREKYVQGIQGTDGGKKPYECYNINN